MEENNGWDTGVNADALADDVLNALCNEADLEPDGTGGVVLKRRGEPTMSTDNLPDRVAAILTGLSPDAQGVMTSFLAAVGTELTRLSQREGAIKKGLVAETAHALTKSAERDTAKAITQYLEEYAAQLQRDTKLDPAARAGLASSILHCVAVINELVSASDNHESPDLKVDPATGKLTKATGDGSLGQLNQRLLQEALAQRNAASVHGRVMMEREMERRGDATPVRKT
jgi:hypothetical protein